MTSEQCVSRLRTVAQDNAAEVPNDTSPEAWLANLATVAADLIEKLQKEKQEADCAVAFERVTISELRADLAKLTRGRAELSADLTAELDRVMKERDAARRRLRDAVVALETEARIHPGDFTAGDFRRMALDEAKKDADA